MEEEAAVARKVSEPQRRVSETENERAPEQDEG